MGQKVVDFGPAGYFGDDNVEKHAMEYVRGEKEGQSLIGWAERSSNLRKAVYGYNQRTGNQDVNTRQGRSTDDLFYSAIIAAKRKYEAGVKAKPKMKPGSSKVVK